MPVFVQEHTMVLDFQVMNMSRTDVILGHEWLHGLGPLLKRSYEHNTITFEANGKHVLLIGERDVPSSPLICNVELSYLELFRVQNYISVLWSSLLWNCLEDIIISEVLGIIFQ